MSEITNSTPPPDRALTADEWKFYTTPRGGDIAARDIEWAQASTAGREFMRHVHWGRSLPEPGERDHLDPNVQNAMYIYFDNRQPLANAIWWLKNREER